MKLFISTNELLFMPSTCLMNATKKNIIYSLVVLCHNQSKLKKLMCVCVCVCVYVCVCVCDRKTSPIISLKAEDKLEIIRLKVKNIRKTFVILR